MLKQLCQLAWVATVALVLVTSPWCGVMETQAAPLPDERSAYCQHTLMQTYKQRTECFTAAQKYLTPSPPVFLLMCCLGTVNSITVSKVYTEYLDISILKYILEKLNNTTQEQNIATFVYKCHKVSKLTGRPLTIVDFNNWLSSPDRPCPV